MQAFFQRVINGGGRIVREVSARAGRLDLCVSLEAQRCPVELKIRRNDATWVDGLEQLGGYMDRLGCVEGWLVVFDQRKMASWDEKLFIRKEKLNGKAITVVGC
jgi:hypothetical protein